MKAIKLELFFPKKKDVEYLGEVLTPNLFTNDKNTIDPNGLYSTQIFGAIGSVVRYSKFGYIDLHTEILHPYIYDLISSMGTMYNNILTGKLYVIFKNGDFEISDVANGNTGYAFFLSVLKDIKFRHTDSNKRTKIIEVIEKYRKKGTLTSQYLLVLPAGLREFKMKGESQVVEDEINNYYREVLSLSKLTALINDNDSLDGLRVKLQLSIDKIYKYIYQILEGKKGFLQGEWASVAVEYRSRTVAVGTPTKIVKLHEYKKSFIDTLEIGLTQFIKAIDPLTKHELYQFVYNRINLEANKFLVYDKGFKWIDVKPKTVERWTLQDEMDNILNSMVDNAFKEVVVKINNKIFIPVIDTGDTITILTENSKVEGEIRGMRYGELFYFLIYKYIYKLPGFITRYPITEQGSLVPVLIDVNSTIINRNVKIVIDDIEKKEYYLENYPILDGSWINGMNIPDTRISGLGADFDGDQILLMVVMEEEAIKEVMDFINSPECYIGTTGEPVIELDDFIARITTTFLTKD
jgi:hypothetical protein